MQINRSTSIVQDSQVEDVFWARKSNMTYESMSQVDLWLPTDFEACL